MSKQRFEYDTEGLGTTDLHAVKRRLMERAQQGWRCIGLLIGSIDTSAIFERPYVSAIPVTGADLASRSVVSYEWADEGDAPRTIWTKYESPLYAKSAAERKTREVRAQTAEEPKPAAEADAPLRTVVEDALMSVFARLREERKAKRILAASKPDPERLDIRRRALKCEVCDAELITDLHLATEHGKLKWERSAVPNTFRAALGDDDTAELHRWATEPWYALRVDGRFVARELTGSGLEPLWVAVRTRVDPPDGRDDETAQPAPGHRSGACDSRPNKRAGRTFLCAARSTSRQCWRRTQCRLRKRPACSCRR